MALRKPAWLEISLDWLNVGAGDWFSETIPLPFISDIHIRIPPFPINFGDWIETAIDGALDVVDAALAVIVAAMATVSDIYQAGLGLMSSVGGLIQSATSDLWAGLAEISGKMAAGFGTFYQAVAAAIDGLRSEMQASILGSILSLRAEVFGAISDAVGAAMAGIRAPINLVNEFYDEISDFFSDPEKYIIDKAESAIDRFW